MMTFSDYLKKQGVDEGLLLPDKPIRPGVPRINVTPFTNAHRRKLHPKPMKAPPPVKPFTSTVPKIVPPKLVAKARHPVAAKRRQGGVGG